MPLKNDDDENNTLKKVFHLTINTFSITFQFFFNISFSLNGKKKHFPIKHRLCKHEKKL